MMNCQRTNYIWTTLNNIGADIKFIPSPLPEEVIRIRFFRCALRVFFGTERHMVILSDQIEYIFVTILESAISDDYTGQDQ